MSASEREGLFPPEMTDSLVLCENIYLLYF